MAHWNICKAMEYAQMLKAEKPELYARINAVIDIDGTYPKWEAKVGKIFLPRENENHIIPQDDTYLTLPEVDLSKYKMCIRDSHDGACGGMLRRIPAHDSGKPSDPGPLRPYPVGSDDALQRPGRKRFR